ncbi:MAG: hypothetical protein FWF18_01055 [Dehalococcoidia bacterium]|nr:hypothetical protein [Dehalococcoidia bacterium]
MRARFYSPTIGRFTQEDTHWNPTNMVYGDDPQDPLGLGVYVPSLVAIWQSGNLYVYCMNNPVMGIDPTGLRTYIVNGINNQYGSEGPQYARDLRDMLVAMGVQDVRIISVYQVKRADGTIQNVLNILDGAGKVIGEMIGFRDTSEAISQMIQNDLAAQALAEGEQLNLIGYSGGGQLVLNAANKLAGKATIDNTVLIGAPAMKINNKNTGQIMNIWSWNDPLSWNISWWNNLTNVRMGGVGHSQYFNSINMPILVEHITKRVK